jgi:hypothetical protein
MCVFVPQAPDDDVSLRPSRPVADKTWEDWRPIPFFAESPLISSTASPLDNNWTLSLTRSGTPYSEKHQVFEMTGTTAAELPTMNKPFKNPKFIFFTDFDGTITLQDSNDFMV